MLIFPRNPLQLWTMRILTFLSCAVLTFAVLSITGCSGKSVVLKPNLPAPPVLCLEQIEGVDGKLVDRDLPAPREHERCPESPEDPNDPQSVREFNGKVAACHAEKGRDELQAWNRAEEAFDLERGRRWACVRYVREVREQ